MSETSTTARPTRTVRTDQIRAGDIVRTHGMRVRIDEIQEHVSDVEYGGTGDSVYACLGTVINMDEVRAAGIVPLSFLRTRVSEGYPADRDDHWNVQGNYRARWQVEMTPVSERTPIGSRVTFQGLSATLVAYYPPTPDVHDGMRLTEAGRYYATARLEYVTGNRETVAADSVWEA